MKKIFQIIREYKFKKLAHQSWSQYGEDLFIDSILKKKQIGFYVDIGCYHPFEFSNTYMFYKRGWSGINIDANIDVIPLFEKYRPRDINIQAAVSNEEMVLEYLKYEGGALNHLSFDGKQLDAVHKFKNKTILKTESLELILSKNLSPSIKKIDFMSIDVEGFDLNVLKSNNWSLYRPSVIAIEDNQVGDLTQIYHNNIVSYLMNLDYKLVGKTYNCMFFVEII
jgi:hypothetical protein